MALNILNAALLSVQKAKQPYDSKNDPLWGDATPDADWISFRDQQVSALERAKSTIGAWEQFNSGKVQEKLLASGVDSRLISTFTGTRGLHPHTLQIFRDSPNAGAFEKHVGKHFENLASGDKKTFVDKTAGPVVESDLFEYGVKGAISAGLAVGATGAVAGGTAAGTTATTAMPAAQALPVGSVAAAQTGAALPALGIPAAAAFEGLAPSTVAAPSSSGAAGGAGAVASGLTTTDVLLASSLATQLVPMLAGAPEMPSVESSTPMRSSTATREQDFETRRALAGRNATAAGVTKLGNQQDLLGRYGSTTPRRRVGQARRILGH